MFSPDQRAKILSHDHAHHLECSDCQYQTLVACVPLSTKHFSWVQCSVCKFYIYSEETVQVVQVAIKNMLVLRWSQRAHCWFWGRPKGQLGAPKGTVPFGKGLAKTPIVLRANCESWQSFIVKTRAPGLRYASQSSDCWPTYQVKPGTLGLILMAADFPLSSHWPHDTWN